MVQIFIKTSENTYSVETGETATLSEVASQLPGDHRMPAWLQSVSVSSLQLVAGSVLDLSAAALMGGRRPQPPADVPGGARKFNVTAIKSLKKASPPFFQVMQSRIFKQVCMKCKTTNHFAAENCRSRRCGHSKQLRARRFNQYGHPRRNLGWDHSDIWRRRSSNCRGAFLMGKKH